MGRTPIGPIPTIITPFGESQARITVSWYLDNNATIIFSKIILYTLLFHVDENFRKYAFDEILILINLILRFSYNAVREASL